MNNQDRQVVADRVDAEIELLLQEYDDTLAVTEAALMQAMLSAMKYAPSDSHGFSLISHCLTEICALSTKHDEMAGEFRTDD